MKSEVSTTILRALNGLVLVLAVATSSAQVPLASGADAEINEDGLHRVDRSVIVGAWVKPDLNLSGYTKIFFMPTVVLFRNIDDRQANQFSVGIDEIYPVSEGMQAQVRERFGAALHDAISDVESYALTDQVGRDVLLVQGRLLDMISAVPPDVTGSRSVKSVRWAWEATVLIEIRDSMSDEILARTVERQRAEGPIDVSDVSMLTPRLIDNWARRLARNVQELSELSR